MCLCLYVSNQFVSVLEGQRRVLDLLELEVTVVASHSTWMLTWALWKRSELSSLSCLSSPTSALVSPGVTHWIRSSLWEADQQAAEVLSLLSSSLLYPQGHPALPRHLFPSFLKIYFIFFFIFGQSLLVA